MEQSISSIIEQKINFFYKKKLIKTWPSHLMHAELAIKYAWRSNTIFDLLKTIIFKDTLCLHKIVDGDNIEIINEVVGSTDDIKMWDFYKSDISDVEYFNTLAISKWTYNEFILSAWVFCIKKKLYSKNILETFIYISAQSFARVFLLNDSLSNTIFSYIVELKLFDFFPAIATKGFIEYLKPSMCEINIEGRLNVISKFLYIFSFFSVDFINECVQDCEKQKNLTPIILALYVFYVNSQNLQNEKKFAFKELDNFKR